MQLKTFHLVSFLTYVSYQNGDLEKGKLSVRLGNKGGDRRASYLVFQPGRVKMVAAIIPFRSSKTFFNESRD
jgi:hypothetical protein